jgi:hypothetical protein
MKILLPTFQLAAVTELTTAAHAQTFSSLSHYLTTSLSLLHLVIARFGQRQPQVILYLAIFAVQCERLALELGVCNCKSGRVMGWR